jgi:hypothetical protein
MGESSERGRSGSLSALLAGLQAGMLGILWMLAWLGAGAAWRRLSFWTAENLMATAFYREAALRADFSGATVSGLALYLLLYSGLGALFALAVRERLSRTRTILAGILFGLCWYYLSYRAIWRSLAPIEALLHPERPTVIGHVIYGAVLGRFPKYLRHEEETDVEVKVTPIAEPAPAPEAAAPAAPETPSEIAE